MDGKACLLRAICETHESPLVGYGMLGELLEVFLTCVQLFISTFFAFDLPTSYLKPVFKTFHVARNSPFK